MKSIDPDFSKISNKQLTEIDSLCCQYEAKRTQGIEVSVETFLQKAALEIRPLLKGELILIELEILDTWDQLRSPEAMIERFPEEEVLIRKQWKSLQQRIGLRLESASNRDTLKSAVPNGSTHDDSRNVLATLQPNSESIILDDPSPRFRIVRNLAQGGIGTVFVAFDRDLKREVAIKELKRKFANDQAVAQRFEAEATVTGNLEHPNIVPIYATGRRSDGRPYYAMRLIQGRSMQAVISELHSQSSRNLDFRKNAAARDLMLRFVTVCRAIGFAHSRGILHRDLKPSNIMVGDFGETLVVDWGLARNIRGAEQDLLQSNQSESSKGIGSDKTLNGTVFGTPGYMSPEQAIGRNEEITTASDIYSLGATLFQILTNTIPYQHTGDMSPIQENRDPVELNSAIQADTNVSVESSLKYGIRNPCDNLSGFPTSLVAICRQAMQFDPGKRYITAELLASDLEAWLLDEPVSVIPETRLQKIRRWAKAHPAIVAGGLASLLFAMLAMGISLSILSIKNESLRQANRREQFAAQESTRNALVAKKNGEEAIRQRQRVLGILNTFLVDVERGLAKVPGSAAIQKNVLATVLNQLGDVSNEFVDDEVNISNAMALMELGDLFSRVGTKDVKLNLSRWNQIPISPIEAASLMYDEALKIALRPQTELGEKPLRIIAMIQHKQAEMLRQTARSAEALPLLEVSLATRKMLLAESPDSVEAAMDVVTSVDYLGQVFLQDGDISQANKAFEETQAILIPLSAKFPNDIEVKRRLGINYSRLADIAVQQGNLELATQLYDQDLLIATEIYLMSPHNGTSKRDLCVSLDRLGNMAAKRGQLEKALESHLESCRLREELVAAEPTDSKSMQELFVSYMKCGDARMSLKDIDRAKSDYAKALLIADEMAQVDPQNATAKRFQSMSAEVLADVALAQSLYDDAVLYAKRSLEISLELAAKDPADAQKRRDLYICHLKVAKVLLGKKEFDECLTQLSLALSIVQSAREEQPESLTTLLDFSFVLLKRAEAYLESGKPTIAAKECETAIQMLESIPETNRQDAVSRRRLANAVTMLGRALFLDGKPDQARREWERSRKLTTDMIDEKIRIEQMKLDLQEIDKLLSTVDPPVSDE